MEGTYYHLLSVMWRTIRMKIVILAFDGIDYFLIHEYVMDGLKQAVCGTTSLKNHMEGGGHKDYITDEIFATFITGTVPDVHKVKLPIDLGFTLNGLRPTIFNLCDSTAIDVPGWNRHPDHSRFQTRVGKAINGKTEVRLRKHMYRYLETEKLPRIMDAFETQSQLTMVYFWFTDIVGHITKGVFPLIEMYKAVERITGLIKDLIDNDTLLMIMSDHGMYQAHHRPEGAFWSLSKSLLNPTDIPEMDEWYDIIKIWLEDNV